ncbi:MAG: cohesin domain-containing protein, partial [Patescibacteria group bacterium]
MKNIHYIAVGNKAKYACGMFIILASVLLFGRDAHAATLSLSPSDGTYSVGNTFTVNILLNTQGAAISGVDVSLNYNPALLDVVDANTPVAGIQITPFQLMPSTAANAVNSSSGKIIFSQVTSGAQTYSNTSAQPLASISFRAKAAGTATLSFDFVPGQTTDSNVAVISGDTSQDVLTNATGASFTITSSTVTPPPPPPPSSTTGITTLTPPANSTLQASTATFTWNAVTGATEYWLYAGSTQGTRNITNSGSLGLNTTATVTNIPLNGATVWIRIWYKVNGVWKSQDFSYGTITSTILPPPPPPSSTTGITTLTPP